MAAPFYNAIKGTTSGTPGTGAFTPNAASTGFRAWSKVPTGWVGLVRYEDGSAWELTFSYWSGTTLSRASTQLFDSSTGSQLTLTSAATAALVANSGDFGPDLGAQSVGFGGSIPNSTYSGTYIAAAFVGTQTSWAPDATSYINSLAGRGGTSVTTAWGQAGLNCGTTPRAISSTTAGLGGWSFTFNFGAITLPTGPCAFIGLTGTTYIGVTAEPSAFVAKYAVLGKDSTDTNFQLLTNDGTTGGTKIDTGIPWVVNGVYRIKLWNDPGSAKVCCLLVRMDTGAIWMGSTNTDVPAAAAMYPQMIGSLNGTNTGTAVNMRCGSFSLYSGA